MPRQRAYHIWTPEEKQRLESMSAEGFTAVEIADALGLRYAQITNMRKQLQCGPMMLAPGSRVVAEYREPDGPLVATVLAPNITEDESTEEFLARYRKRAAKSVAVARVQHYATVKIASDKPVGIVVQGDQHIDGTGTDLDFLEHTAKYVGRTDGLYTIDIGDLLQNNIVHRDKDVRAVADQLRFGDIYIEWFRGKWLGSISGNHTDWTKSVAGFDHVAAFAKRHRFHFVPDELLWKVQIVNPHNADEVTAEWLIATRHQFRRHSNMNPEHACYRWMEERVTKWGVVPDVLAIAHNHTACVGVRNFDNRDVWAVRPGSAQVESAYARAKGFQDFRPTMPTIVLPPTRDERIVCFSDPDQAVRFMRGWRDVAA
jgi:hypothetical protein